MKTSKRSILPCPIVSPCRPNSHFPKHVRHATTYNLYPHADIPFEFPHRNSGAVLASCQCVGRIVSYKCLRSSPRRIAYYSLGIVNRRTDRACRLETDSHSAQTRVLLTVAGGCACGSASRVRQYAPRLHENQNREMIGCAIRHTSYDEHRDEQGTARA